jgi:hypothetical protein
MAARTSSSTSRIAPVLKDAKPVMLATMTSSGTIAKARRRPRTSAPPLAAKSRRHAQCGTKCTGRTDAREQRRKSCTTLSMRLLSSAKLTQPGVPSGNNGEAALLECRSRVRTTKHCWQINACTRTEREREKETEREGEREREQERESVFTRFFTIVSPLVGGSTGGLHTLQGFILRVARLLTCGPGAVRLHLSRCVREAIKEMTIPERLI